MFGLMVLVAVLVVLGFLLAWIIGIVAQEEVSIGQGVLILLCTGVCNMLLGVVLQKMAPQAADWAGIPVSFAVLTSMVWLIAKVEFKKAAIIGLVFSVILFVVSLGLAAAFSPSGS